MVSSVIMITGQLGFYSEQGKIFFSWPHHQSSCLPGVNWLLCEADNQLLSGAQAKNAWSYTSSL
jgi:hypothetical protein